MPHIVCISASNIRHARQRSTSSRACRLIAQILGERWGDSVTVDTILLVDHELKPCHGCGHCFAIRACSSDAAFNALYSRLTRADALFVVAPHYAPIPAKLCMLLEKVEQMAFLPRFHDEAQRSPLCGRPVGIIGHGGGTEEIMQAYRGPVLDTIANALGWPVEMKVVGPDETWPTGVVFPVKRVRCDPQAVFPVQEYDWDEVRRRIEPLVLAVVAGIPRP